MDTTVLKQLLWAAFLLPGTSACISSGHMDSGLKALIGENVSTAIAVLGKPATTDNLGNGTLYVWDARRVEVRPETTARTVGGSTMETNVRTTMYLQHEYYCTVRLLVNSAGRITNAAHDGNRGGCDDYDKLLANHAERARTGRQP